MPYTLSIERIARADGIQHGRQEGRREGELVMLLRLLTLKFGPPSDAIRQRIESADAETLLRWSERVLTATRAEEVTLNP